MDIGDSIGTVTTWLVYIVIFFLVFLKTKKKGAKSKSKTATPKTPTMGASSSFTTKELQKEKKTSSGKIHGGEHTHDRLDYDCYDPGESKMDHYIKQLKGFQKAGLIDRSEYNVLVERYRKFYSDNGGF